MLKTFWESYFVYPWANWSIGANMHVPCLLPSNQMVEAFIRNVVRALGGRGQLRKTATTVLHHMLPLVMNDEDSNFSDELCFQVHHDFQSCIHAIVIVTLVRQVDYVHPQMLLKARVLAAPPASHPPRLYHGMFKVVFRNKFMYICNRYEDESIFSCAYIYREKGARERGKTQPNREVYKAPLTLDAIRLYEESYRGAVSRQWNLMPKTPQTLAIAKLEFEHQAAIMTVCLQSCVAACNFTRF